MIYGLGGSDFQEAGLPLSGGTLTGSLLFSPDNTNDLGSAALRVRTGYFGTGLRIGADEVLLKYGAVVNSNGLRVRNPGDTAYLSLAAAQFSNGSGGAQDYVLSTRGLEFDSAGSVGFGANASVNVDSDTAIYRKAAARKIALADKCFDSTPTAGVVLDFSTNDVLKIRNWADTDDAKLVSYGATMVWGLLSSTAGIDLSNTNKQNLYTVPASRSCIVTDVIFRNPSADISLATVSMGFDAAATNVYPGPLTLVPLTTAAAFLSAPVTTTVEHTIGAAAEVFGLDTVTQEAAADTVTVDVFGYLF